MKREYHEADPSVPPEQHEMRLLSTEYKEDIEKQLDDMVL